MKIGSWTRSEYTTKGSDPTVVVTWNNPDGTHIREFQGVYGTQVIGRDEVFEPDPIAVLGESLHKALEAAYQQDLELKDILDNGLDRR